MEPGHDALLPAWPTIWAPGVRCMAGPAAAVSAWRRPATYSSVSVTDPTVIRFTIVCRNNKRRVPAGNVRARWFVVVRYDVPAPDRWAWWACAPESVTYSRGGGPCGRPAVPGDRAGCAGAGRDLRPGSCLARHRHGPGGRACPGLSHAAPAELRREPAAGERGGEHDCRQPCEPTERGGYGLPGRPEERRRAVHRG